jgi:mono/diheme cytochrome c family protein
MRAVRIAAAAAGIAAFGAAAFVAWIVFAPGPMGFADGRRVALSAYDGPSPAGVPVELRAANLVTRGEYLTRAADCQACHTVDGGVPFAGGRAFKLPFGTIYAPNITPDPDTGIGQWSDAEFIRAVHKGIGRDGQRLYPAFPYAAYTLLSDDDVAAIKAYLFSLKPIHNIVPATTLAFPFNQRPLMAVWSAMFNAGERFEPIPDRGAKWNRGAYLVEAAGHCGECHTPRNLLQALDNRRKFVGAVAAGWKAYDITPDKPTGIGNWSDEQVANYLLHGHAAGHGAAAGPMGEAVDMSLAFLSSSDVDAVVAYLRSVPALRADDLPNTLAPAPTSPPAEAASNPLGHRIFESACASCHDWNGTGALRPAAALTGDRAVNDPSAINVVQIVLSGRQNSAANGRGLMPAFGAAYTDDEIAAVANYVTRRFGSSPSQVQASDVAGARAATQ